MMFSKVSRLQYDINCWINSKLLISSPECQGNENAAKRRKPTQLSAQCFLGHRESRA